MSNDTIIEEVKRWFSPLKVLDIPVVTQHLLSLQKYQNEKVKSWTKIFAECLRDIRTTPNQNEIMKTSFIEKCDKPSDTLNIMTKKEFVQLFAKIMNEIINEEIQQQQPQRDLEDEDRDRREAEELKSYNRFPGGSEGGSSKKKSRKRATTRNRIRRRSRSRRASTRKYKK